MSWLAWTVFAVFLAWVVGDGLRRSRGTRDLEDYYAGGRRIPWWAAGLSIMATQASAITVIGTTGQGYEQGMGFLQTYLGLPFAMILLSVFLVPVLRRAPILTAYQYLEGRFNPATRGLASLIFLVSRCGALGFVIYGPSVVLSAMTGLQLEVTVLIIGALTTVYTVFGGINAVVWTDVKQMSVIVVGLCVCFGILVWDVTRQLGFGQVLTVVGAAGKLNALEVVPASTDFIPRLASDVADGVGKPSFWEQKYNFWSGLFGGLFLMMAYFGCDQSQVQRILTNPTANQSRKALLVSAFAKVPMQTGVLFIGVLLYLFHALNGGPLLYKPGNIERARAPENAAQLAGFEARFENACAERRELLLRIAALDDDPRSHPEVLRRYQDSVRAVAAVREQAAAAFDDSGKKDDINYIFPHFILHNLHPLILGLIIAAIFAAAMSSVDSVLNSLSAATIVDFYQRWIRPRASDRQNVRAGRVATLFWGVSATAFALFFAGGGSLIEKINAFGSYFYGSLLGVFTLAVLVPRARGWAGFLGLCGGMAAVMLVHSTIVVEFLWYNVIGCLGVLLVGGVAALIPRRDT